MLQNENVALLRERCIFDQPLIPSDVEVNVGFAASFSLDEVIGEGEWEDPTLIPENDIFSSL